jgi:Na+-transporting methylmalonyl-CoA/oxaloacetate decarboxylase, beta subunit
MEHSSFFDFIISHLGQFLSYTAFANMTFGHIIMILVGLAFIYLAIAKEYEPMLLVPIGFGILVGNIAFFPGLKVGIYENGSVLNYLYFGVLQGVYPPLIFLGIGAMTDFSALISNPKLILIGAAASWDFRGLRHCAGYRILTRRSRCNWDYWWCRRSNGNLPLF